MDKSYKVLKHIRFASWELVNLGLPLHYNLPVHPGFLGMLHVLDQATLLGRLSAMCKELFGEIKVLALSSIKEGDWMVSSDLEGHFLSDPCPKVI